MAIDARNRRKYQSGGYAANPYAMGTSAANLELEAMKSKAKQVQAGGETTKKIEGMKQEFSAKKTKAMDKQEKALDKAMDKAKEEQKEAQRKANKNKGLFGGLKILGSLLGPIAGGVITGLTTGAQARQQKKALQGLGGGLKDIAKHLEGTKIGLGDSWKGRVSGLNWLADPTKGVEKGISSSLKQGYQSMEEGAGEVKAQAGKIDPFKQALMSGLTTFAMGKASGKEGLFSKDAGFTPGKEAVYKPGTAFDPTQGAVGSVDASGLRVMEPQSFLEKIPESSFPELVSEGVDPTKIGFGQRLKEQLLGGGVEDFSKLGKKEKTDELLKQLTMYQGILGDDFNIPEVGYTPQYYTGR